MNSFENNLFEETFTPKKNVWMVGLFDVLGFSARVKEDGVDKVYDDYQKLIKSMSDKPAIDTGGMSVPVPEVGDGAGLFSMGGKLNVNYTYFSDTILLWLPFYPMCRKIFLQRCTDLMCEALLMKIPLRGAIAVGEGYMHKKKGIYLGQHIVDAAQLELAQDQIGVGMARSAATSYLIPSACPTQYIEYNVPIKESKDKDWKTDYWAPCALDWARHWRDCNYEDLIPYLGKLCPDDKRYEKYYNNAIKFAKWSLAHNDWHKHPDKASDFKYIKKLSYQKNK
jgi:hypothetical protein